VRLSKGGGEIAPVDRRSVISIRKVMRNEGASGGVGNDDASVGFLFLWDFSSAEMGLNTNFLDCPGLIEHDWDALKIDSDD
jgi:hypothetical protein